MKMKKLEELYENRCKFPGFAPMPDWPWRRTDYGLLKDSKAISFKGTSGEFESRVFDQPKYEVHRDTEKNNFVITVHPAGNYAYDWVGHEEVPEDGVVTDFFRITRNMDRELNYMKDVLNENHSTIVYCYQNPKESVSFYDIYYYAWDMGDKPTGKYDSPHSGFDDYNYLQSRLKANGLHDCKFSYREIRNGIVYPCPFLWYEMSPEDIKTHIQDKKVIELLKQAEDDYLKKRGVDKAMELVMAGKPFDEVFEKTKVKGWQVHRAFLRGLF